MFNLSLVILLSPCSTRAQDKQETSPAYQEAWQTTDLNLRVEKLNQAIQEKPNLVPAHYYLGLTLSQLKRYDEAIAAYRRLIQIPAPSTDLPSPRFHLAAHYELGKISLTMSRYEAAATEYRWLKERSAQDGAADELALFLSDLFPKHAAEQHQVPVSPMIVGNSEQDAAGDKERNVVPMKRCHADSNPFKEKARYTEIARLNKVQGSVLLSVVFTEDARVTNIRVVQGRPMA